MRAVQDLSYIFLSQFFGVKTDAELKKNKYSNNKYDTIPMNVLRSNGKSITIKYFVLIVSHVPNDCLHGGYD